MAIEAVYLESSQLLRVLNLVNVLDASEVTSASIEATLYDSSDTEVVGETWPLTLQLIAGETNSYSATTSSTLSLAENALYYAKIVADAGGGLVQTFKIDCRAIWYQG